MKKKSAARYTFFDRDISWLSFNDRVLAEAERSTVPLMERIRFLSIYSSNLDEFYRVRVPAIKALKSISTDPTFAERYGRANDETEIHTTINAVNKIVMGQQAHFGLIMTSQILPALMDHGIHLIHQEAIPESIHQQVEDYFMSEVAAFMRYTRLTDETSFFPENNQLYIAVSVKSKSKVVYLVNIPTDNIPRFHSFRTSDKHYVTFLDDIIKHNLSKLFPDEVILSKQSIKITRDSDLNLDDEYVGNLARKIEKQIRTRDRGLATRFLYEPGIQTWVLEFFTKKFQLDASSMISGGQYHNLKDLSKLPLYDAKFNWETWPRVTKPINAKTLFEEVRQKDILLHTPFNSYDTVLRFFNEASIDPNVKSIYVTLYRIARDSRIANALIGAASHGKKVIVLVELKARFDEENNIKWMKRMKAAGVKIIESIPGLKVHAKLALVKRRSGNNTELIGLFATGNFNEITSRFYTDHVLMTSRKELLSDADTLFKFLRKRRKRTSKDNLDFKHLLVGHFNLQERFLELIDVEIANATAGLPAEIVIKFNNLEDRVLISKLYDASCAGVRISLIVRGICCLIPGIVNQSENIHVMRIVDRYLEHGRIFKFGNNGNPAIFLGSADWMNRNVYRRIEVCFPIEQADLKMEVLNLLKLQLADNCQAVVINSRCENVDIPSENSENRSQKAIGNLILSQTNLLNTY